MANTQSPKEIEVIGQMEEILGSIRDENIHKKCQPAASPGVTETCLEIIQGEVKELEDNVNAYEEDGNSTAKYQKLQWRCSKLVVDQDNLLLSGRDKLRKERKSLLVRIEAAADKLEGKKHGTRKPSPGCEVIVSKKRFLILKVMNQVKLIMFI